MRLEAWSASGSLTAGSPSSSSSPPVQLALSSSTSTLETIGQFPTNPSRVAAADRPGVRQELLAPSNDRRVYYAIVTQA